MFCQTNGKRLHLEVFGQGRPLILLHGNGENWRIFEESIPLLSEDFTVYAVDLAGHGESDRVQCLHYADQAEDIAGLIAALGLEKPLLYGFSDGGIIGLLVGIRHPDLLSGLIVSGVNIHPSGLKWKTRAEIFQSYLKTHSDLDRLMLKEPHIRKKDLSGLTLPVNMTAGEKDCVKASHTKKIAKWIPRARLAVFPSADHGSYIVHSRQIGAYIRSLFPNNLVE